MTIEIVDLPINSRCSIVTLVYQKLFKWKSTPETLVFAMMYGTWFLYPPIICYSLQTGSHGPFFVRWFTSKHRDFPWLCELPESKCSHPPILGFQGGPGYNHQPTIMGSITMLPLIYHPCCFNPHTTNIILSWPTSKKSQFAADFVQFVALATKNEAFFVTVSSPVPLEAASCHGCHRLPHQ